VSLDRLKRYARPIILYHYVVWEYLKNFALALLICALVFLLAALYRGMTEIEDFGVTLGQMLPLSVYFLPYALTHALPLATMIAAILVFGRLAADNEVLAAQSGGASIGMLAAPLLFCGLVFSAVSLWCNDVGLGWGFATLRDKFFDVSKPKVLERISQPGARLTWALDNGNTLHINCLAEEADADGQTRRPIHIAYFRQGQLQQSLYARHYAPELLEAEKKLLITLEDGQAVGEERSRSRRMNLKRFQRLEHIIPLPALDENQFSYGRSTGTVSLFENYAQARESRVRIGDRKRELMEEALFLGAQAVGGASADPARPLLASQSWAATQSARSQLDAARGRMRKQLSEFHRKLSLSAMPFSMIFLGLGLGLLVRKGNRLIGFVLGILCYALVYYQLMVLTKELAAASILPPAGLWATNVILMLLGLGLCLAYEYGFLGGGTPAWARPDWLYAVGRFGWGFLQRFLDSSPALPLRLRADRHVAGLLVAPLLVLAVGVGMLYVALDLVEHGNEVVVGIVKAHEPLEGLEARGVPRAMLDVVVFYLIRGAGLVFDLMPILLLIAGVLAVVIMVRNNEHLIYKSCGTRLQRAFRPLVLIAALVSLLVSAAKEFVMPGLVMERDRLKPLVYHRGPKPRSTAGVAQDARGEPVLFEVARYSHNLKVCEGLYLYLPRQAVNGRLPRVEADRAVWDEENARWRLFLLNADGSELATDSRGRQTRYAPGGRFYQPETVPGDPLDEPARFSCRSVEFWSGQLTPAFLESQDLGPSVMRIGELWAARDGASFRSELWRRCSEWLIGFLLLMVAIPLLVAQQTRSLLLAVGWCVVYGACYLGPYLLSVEAARLGYVSAWFPVLPHLAFLVLGVWRYTVKMET
jgi:lipopolysaccharide export system permease protein